MTFRVTDEATGSPVEGATVHISYAAGWDPPAPLTGRVDGRGEVTLRLVNYNWTLSIEAGGGDLMPVSLPRGLFEDPPKRIEVALAGRSATLGQATRVDAGSR